MEEDVLSTVVALEKGIQVRIEAEMAAAGEWLETVRIEIQEDCGLREEHLRESARISACKLKDEAFSKAAEIVRDAEERERLLLAASDEKLSAIIMKRLHDILPDQAG